MSPDDELTSCIPGRDRGRTSPAGLPAPGPAPLRPAPETVVILIVIIISVLWLLAGGYSVTTALGIITVTAHLAASVTTRLGCRPAHSAQQSG